MARVTWSVRAVADLWEIRDYIAQDAPVRAERFIDRLIKRTTILRTQPFVGRMVPEGQLDTLREVFEGAYRIVYSIEPDGNIIIARVAHGAQMLSL